MNFTAPYSIVFVGSLAVRFHSEHLANLRASGLSDDTIRAARRVLDPSGGYCIIFLAQGAK